MFSNPSKPKTPCKAPFKAPVLVQKRSERWVWGEHEQLLTLVLGADALRPILAEAVGRQSSGLCLPLRLAAHAQVCAFAISCRRWRPCLVLRRGADAQLRANAIVVWSGRKRLVL